mmetsp:Transcript_14095/g.18452  ORF Transcript_14095/g.18452 Transcript_14095/m.18452 type:complete len:408 (+) Transcript_14095:216-1439(+)
MCIFCEQEPNSVLRSQLTDAEILDIEKCSNLEKRVPVTIVTGFLGAGKSTLLNQLISEVAGTRFCVVQNEFGSVPIDDVILREKFSETEMVTLSSGCVCCKVRGDLVSALVELVKKSTQGDKTEFQFDAVIIETSGLSSVGPVAQTFFANSFIQRNFRLDAIVTVVAIDNLHRILLNPNLQCNSVGVGEDNHHNTPDESDDDVCSASDSGTGDSDSDTESDDSDEEKSTKDILLEQISYADVIVLNKIDLEGCAAQSDCETALRTINSTATILPCRKAYVDASKVLNINAFSAETVISNETVLSKNSHGHHSFKSISLHRIDEIDELAFTDWLWDVLQQFGRKIPRVKGVVYFKGIPTPSLVQCVNAHAEITRFESIPDAAPRSSTLVLIGNIKDMESKLIYQFEQL